MGRHLPLAPRALDLRGHLAWARAQPARSVDALLDVWTNHRARRSSERTGADVVTPSGRVCQTPLGASTPSTCSSHGCHFARIVSTSAGVFP